MKWDELVDMYGEEGAKNMRIAGTASLIGADLAEGHASMVNAEMDIDAAESKQAEIAARASQSISNILVKKDKVQSAQTLAFVKSGVKLEGSAIDVLQETAHEAFESARVRQKEADFAIGQEEVSKSVAKAKARMAPWETALNIGGSVVSGVGSIK